MRNGKGISANCNTVGRQDPTKRIRVGPTESVTLSAIHERRERVWCCVDMASLGTPAHVSSNKKPLHRWSWKAKRVRCAVSPPTWREGLRTVSLSLVISHLLLIPNRTCLFHRFFFRMVDWFLFYDSRCRWCCPSKSFR